MGATVVPMVSLVGLAMEIDTVLPSVSSPFHSSVITYKNVGYTIKPSRFPIGGTDIKESVGFCFNLRPER